MFQEFLTDFTWNLLQLKYIVIEVQSCREERHLAQVVAR